MSYISGGSIISLESRSESPLLESICCYGYVSIGMDVYKKHPVVTDAIDGLLCNESSLKSYQALISVSYI